MIKVPEVILNYAEGVVEDRFGFFDSVSDAEIERLELIMKDAIKKYEEAVERRKKKQENIEHVREWLNSAKHSA